MQAKSATRNSEAARAAILAAALKEFAAEGLEGARTDQIARAARVNKALIHYYFKDKETLYGAVLDHVFASMFGRLNAALDQDFSPRERICAFVEAHFDFIAGEPVYPRLIQREMMRAGRKPSPHLKKIFTKYAMPVMRKVTAAMLDGIEAGSIRAVDPRQAILSMLGVNVFYFISSPGQKMITNEDPLHPARIAERRSAVIDFISHALFINSDNAAQETRNVSAQTAAQAKGNSK